MSHPFLQGWTGGLASMGPRSENRGYSDASRLSGRREHTDFNINAGGQAQAFVERLDGFSGRLQDIDQTLVRPDLELLARLPINVRAAQHGIAFDPRGQRNGAVNHGAGPLGGLDDLG